MKRIISFILVLCLLLSVCGCKREDPEDTAAPLDITEEAPEKEELPEDEPEKEQAKGDKAEPCNLTLENTFSQYEVIVTLTKEETEKGKEYTAKDFADYDVFYVLENDAYYGNPSFKDSYPEYQGRTTLFMYLNEPSKENVLKTVKKLEADERVFAACPNPVPASNELILYFTEEYNKELMTLAAEYDKIKAEYPENPGIRRKPYQEFMLNFGEKITEEFCFNEFCEFNVWGYSSVTITPEITVLITFKEETDSLLHTYEAIKEYSQNHKIKKIKPKYTTEYYTGEVVFHINTTDYDESKPYTAEDFKKYTDMKIINIEHTKLEFTKKINVKLNFENPTYQQLIDMAANLKTNKKVLDTFLLLIPLKDTCYVDTEIFIY